MPGGPIIYCSLKPRTHQQQCPSNIVECYKLNDSFDKCCFRVERNSCARNITLDCFDKVERSFDNVACFDIVAGVDGALVNRIKWITRRGMTSRCGAFDVSVAGRLS